MLSENTYFHLLRFALGIDEHFDGEMLAPDDWKAIYQLSERQALLGVVFDGVKRLQGNNVPPFSLLMQWTVVAEKICGINQKFYAECERLTRFFEEHGRKSAILKGQANSLLYPNVYSRNPGDIDIYVDGGKKSVVKLLKDMGLVSQKELDIAAYHHVGLDQTQSDIEVEVHYRPSGGFFNPFCNKRLQKFLVEEAKNSTMTEQGFYVPTIKFALAMQLAHILYHFIEEGVGLRQITDYYFLLKHSSEDDRETIAGMLDGFGVKRFTSALMSVLKDIYHLDESLMLCVPDEKKGKILFDEIIGGGNFGKYRANRPQGSIARTLEGKFRQWNHRASLYPREVHWSMINAIGQFFAKLPYRIKYKQFSFR